MMSTNDGSADNDIPIFLLKTESTPNDGYEEQFSKARDGIQFSPIFVPVLQHIFQEEGLCTVRNLLQRRQINCDAESSYGGLIFTSQRAVEAFAKLVEEGKGEVGWPHLRSIPIYTVGPATSRALRAIPQDPPLEIFGAETGNGEALAHYMLEHYRDWYKDRSTLPSLLFLVGDQRRDIIPKTLLDPRLSADCRIQVDELVVYGTGIMESFEQDFPRVLRDTEAKRHRWVVVFSPTGCEVMLRSLNMLDPATGRAKCRPSLESTFVATIGPTTRDFLKKRFDFEPHVCAERPSPDGIEEGILIFMKERFSNV